MLALEIHGLSVKYGGVTILDKISVDFSGGEMVAVIGKNGVGKTTFIKAVAGLLPHSGWKRLDDGGTAYTDKAISYVPQMNSSSSRLTVFEMVLLGLVKDLRWKVGEEQLTKAESALNELGLAQLADQPFHKLSGGQKQLIFMAQSFISHPKVLLLDEPTSALDLRHQLIVMEQAKKYTRRTGAVTLFVVHDLMLAARYSDKMILIDDAGIRMQGTPEKVLFPDLLEEVYGVSVVVEKNSRGPFTIIPQVPL
jgi:iron complex transport system ATP-binding protein